MVLNVLFESSQRALGAALFCAIGYVSYADHQRFERMIRTYRRGYAFHRFYDTKNETVYLHRKNLEKKLHSILKSQFTNEYYFIRGEVGTGKSRSVMQVVRELINSEGSKGQGAPIYVLASQGKTFSDSLAEAVKFYFDEHINFSFFVSLLMGIDSFPGKDDKLKLVRVLNAIEKSACIYAARHQRPVVMVIDGTQTLKETHPEVLEKLQEKAKLWADLNICKIIFVCNEENIDDVLEHSNSYWSRVGTPLFVDDLSKEEALDFLTEHSYKTANSSTEHTEQIPLEQARDIYDVVGGRVLHLLRFKRDAANGIDFETTRDNLLTKDKAKFINIKKTGSMWEAIEFLLNQDGHSCELTDILEYISKEAIDECFKRNIVKMVRGPMGISIHFESRLCEVNAEEIAASNA